MTAQMQRSGFLQNLSGMLDDTARKLQAAADPAGMQDTSATGSTQVISINTVGNSSSSSLSMGSAGDAHAEAITAPTAGSSGSGSKAGPANPQRAQLDTVAEDLAQQLLPVWMSVHHIMPTPPQDTLLPVARLAMAALQYLSSPAAMGAADACSGTSEGVSGSAEHDMVLLHCAVQCLTLSTRAFPDPAGLPDRVGHDSQAGSVASGSSSLRTASQLLHDPDYGRSLGYALLLTVLASWLQQRSTTTSNSSSGASGGSAGGTPNSSEQLPNITQLVSDLPVAYSDLLQQLGCSPEIGLRAAADIANKGYPPVAERAQTGEEHSAVQVMRLAAAYSAFLEAVQARSAGVQAQQPPQQQQQLQRQQELQLHLLLVPALLQWLADSPSSSEHLNFGHVLACRAAACALQHVRDLSAAAPAAVQAAIHDLRGSGVGKACASLTFRVAPAFLQTWRALYLHLHTVPQAAAAASVLEGAMSDNSSRSSNSSNNNSMPSKQMDCLLYCGNTIDQAANVLLFLVLPYTAFLREVMQLRSGCSVGQLCVVLEDFLRSGLFAHNLLCHNALDALTTTVGNTSSSSSIIADSSALQQQHQPALPQCFAAQGLTRAGLMITDPKLFSLWQLLLAQVAASQSLVDPVALQLYRLLVSMLKMGTNSSSSIKYSQCQVGEGEGERRPATTLQAQQLAVVRAARWVLQCFQQPPQPPQQDPQPGAAGGGTPGLSEQQQQQQQQQYVSASSGTVSASLDAEELLPWFSLLGRLLLQWGGELQQLHGAFVQAVGSPAAGAIDCTAAAISSTNKQQVDYTAAAAVEPPSTAAVLAAAQPAAHASAPRVGQPQQVDSLVGGPENGTAVNAQQQAGGSGSSIAGHPELVACLGHLTLSAAAIRDVVVAIAGCFQAGGVDEVVRQWEQLGYTKLFPLVHLLSSTNAAVGGVQVAGEVSLDGAFASNVQDLWQLLLSLGGTLAAFAHPYCCNNPVCGNVEGPSEAALVGGCSCICAGCNTARYCCKPCQKAHWKQHKPVCKALAAAAAAATDDAGAFG